MDPRVARTHDAVMQAATDLLLEGGPAALTVDGVVARSGVAKSTVYRHWATRDALVLDVLSSCAPHLETIDESLDFADALRALVESFAAVLGDEHWARVMPSMLMLKNELDPLTDLDNDMKQEQAAVVTGVLQRGVDEGALPAAVLDDVDLSVTLLAGPVLMAGLTGMVPLDEVLVDRVIAQFMAGQSATAPAV
jgi:AcrR family transcriptional regulator